MSEKKEPVSYHKSWQIKVAGMRLIEFSNDHGGFVVYTENNELLLFNQAGHELWHAPANYQLTSLSMADNLEILAVDNDKHAILFGQEGATLWRKRPFPAITGRISANGELFSFITAEPAIVGTDRSLRSKWAYRNLMRRPNQLEISGSSDCIAFPCTDERGEGLGAVNQNGQPLEAFMGLGRIISIALSTYATTALVLSTQGHVYCLNLLRGAGIWKGVFGSDLSGIAYAVSVGETLVYSNSGHLAKLSDAGLPLWEYQLPDRLLKAWITADGSTIFFATENGQIGALAQGAGSIDNRVVFRETEAKPVPVKHKSSFMKVWNIDLVGNPEQQSRAYTWKGQDGVEYCLTWDGVEKLFCINDLGEEVWSKRLPASRVIDLAVSSEADMAIAITSSGIIGFDLSGGELFRFLGQFKRVHIFNDGAMVLLDNLGQCKFYLSPDHFSHQLEIDELIISFSIVGERLLLRSERVLYLLTSEGILFNQLAFKSLISCCNLSSDGKYLLCGDSDGQAYVYDHDLHEVFTYRLNGIISLLEYNSALETLFIGSEDELIRVLNRRSGEIFQASLAGRPALMTAHEVGALVGTELDQLGLITSEGQILARYTSPHHLKKMLPCHRKMSMIVLADEALTCIAAVTSLIPPQK